MAIFILIALVIVALYINSYTNRDKNLDYQLTPQYQKSANDDKLRTDIIKGLEVNIKKDILKNNRFSRVSKREEIEDFINMREATFYMHIESISKQHKLSHNVTFDTIFNACNYARLQFGIPTQKDNFSK